MQIGDIEGTAEWLGTFSLVAGAPIGDLPGRRIDLLPWSDGSPAILACPEDGKVWQVQPMDSHARTALVQSRAAGTKALVSVTAGEGARVVLRAQIFQRCVQFPPSSPLVVLVTEAVESTMPNWAREEGVISFLQREFLAGDVAFALMGEDEDHRAFRLIGSRFVLDCRIGRLGHPQTMRLDRKRRDVDGKRVSLLRGAIRFEDTRLTTSHLTEIRDMTSQLQSEEGSFFGMWKTYQELSETLLDQQRFEAGTLRYQRVSTRWEDGTLVFVFALAAPPHPAFLGEGTEVEVTQEDSESEAPKRRIRVGQVLSRTPSLELRVSAARGVGEDVPGKGLLQLSQSGDRVMLRRRQDALRLLQEHQTQLPTLSQLLEQGDAPTAQPRTFQPLTDRVRRLLPSPTEQQTHALDVALNTPDIALIQGPPGTGKTSVIRALMTRLAELQDNRIRGQSDLDPSSGNAPVLITSEQHDAVQHAVDGFDAGGLPVYRYSRRREESRLEERELDRWVIERIESCRKRLQQHGATPARILARNAERLVLRWREASQTEEKKMCLTELLSACGTSIPPGILTMLVQAIDRLNVPSPPANPESEYEQRIRVRLRTLVDAQPRNGEDYDAVGALHASRLADFMDKNADVLNRSVPELLQQAAQGHNPFPDEVGHWEATLAEILKTDLLDGEAPDQADSDINQLLSDLIDHLRVRAREGADGIVDAVEAFAEDLEDPGERRAMIEKYARVVAATCQQSVSKAYAEGDPEFEFVVVDEAARANPLDLLIPLSRGKRIVLVGDQRQLPQMLEPDIVDAYRSLHSNCDERLLQQSLFERLFDLFKKTEQRGGPERAVMLTDDFRMHPSISRLVSDLFYDGAVTSRCTAEQRAHGLQCYRPGPFCWVNVPHARGAETGGQSKRRESEARVVVEELQRILGADEKVSVGVITFYERQAALLAELCGRLPIEWQYRIRTGTVDAFQGREFDVVLLSTVRSNRESPLRRRVGFLAYPNRLCVAFSRARKLLITVGDAETIAGSVERPIVHEFLTLLTACQGAESTYVDR